MKTTSELRAAGLADLDGKWKSVIIFIVAYLAVAIIIGVGFGLMGAPDVLTNLLGLALLPLAWGAYVAFLNNQRGEEDSFSISRLFDGYCETRIFTTMFLVQLYTSLWTLLLIVPGIIKSLSYSMTSFILLDNPEMKNNEAIEESMRMMEGHKMELFFLWLSFIGWILLSIVTLGIALFWVAPYMYSSIARFYTELKGENNVAAPQIKMTDNYVK